VRILNVFFVLFLFVCVKDVLALDIKKLESKVPKLWSENVPGVKTHLDTQDSVVALTLDACGSKTDSYDEKLINYLIKEKIPATLFICGRWIDKNPEIFKKLASNKLFEIGNHGLKHKPCSVNGKAIYGIEGTKNVKEVIDEIELNAKKIFSITGHAPRYYRSGTAYYDEVALALAQELGFEVVGFSVLGDKGASLSAQEVEKVVSSSKIGSIIIAHMNHPESCTAEGLIAAIPKLKQQGIRFVKLSEYNLK